MGWGEFEPLEMALCLQRYYSLIIFLHMPASNNLVCYYIAQDVNQLRVLLLSFLLWISLTFLCHRQTKVLKSFKNYFTLPLKNPEKKGELHFPLLFWKNFFIGILEQFKIRSEKPMPSTCEGNFNILIIFSPQLCNFDFRPVLWLA